MTTTLWLCLSMSVSLQGAKAETPEMPLAPQLVTLAVVGGAGDQ
jgi:hypothetical protein